MQNIGQCIIAQAVLLWCKSRKGLGGASILVARFVAPQGGATVCIGCPSYIQPCLGAILGFSLCFFISNTSAASTESWLVTQPRSLRFRGSMRAHTGL